MTTRVALSKEETYPLKGSTRVKAAPIDKCTANEEESKSSFTSRLMTMPNFTIFVVLLALICILGESVLHNAKNRDTHIKTNPNSLDILLHENSSVTYTYAKDLKTNIIVGFNTSRELTFQPPSLTFSPTNKTGTLTIKGVAVTSRAYIDIKTCVINETQAPCTFDYSNIFVTVVVSHSRFLGVLIQVTGWVYFFAWSISFYPQIILNFRRRSVEGLNFDFLVLNIIGFFCYSVYNVLFYFDPEVQELYIEKDPRAQIPVLLNDVVFALHALFACIITGIQCFFYERGQQRVSFICMGWSGILLLFSGGTLIATLFKALNWLKFITFLSYVKMAVTLSKYFPQAILNFRRKSTVGWSIGNVLLDFTGGSMDIVQMVLQGANTNDWTAFYGNVVKFGLGLVSMIFDTLFIIQHYFLYRHSENYEINHEHNTSGETTVQAEGEEEEEGAAFDNGVYH